MISGLEIRPADPFSQEATDLCARLSAELAAMYPEYSDSGRGAFEPADAAGPASAFLIAWLDGQAVGCAALRPMEPGVAEFKRLYVEPGVRRHGIAGQLLAELEQQARRLRYTSVRLETGARQPGSIRAVQAAGYERIANYGTYAGNPLSLCFEKRLSSSIRSTASADA